MNAIQVLRDQGQSLWLDKISREMLDDGTLERYRDDLSITGLTSNPTIFAEAMGHGSAYDEQIRELTGLGVRGDRLFFELALADLRRAADLFRPIFEQTQGRDGWVSMEVSPLLIHDPVATALAAKEIHKAAGRPNLFVKIPGTEEGISAIEETIFAGIPVNITLLFSATQYLAVADAYMRALERRSAAGLTVEVPSVASLFVSRWDKAVVDKVPERLHNKLGIAVAQQAYKAYWELLNSRRWHDLESAGARAQRLLWASTGTKDPQAPATLYVTALGAPNTIDTMPENTLLTLAEASVPAGGGLLSRAADPRQMLESFKLAGIDIDALANQLQTEGGESFKKSWHTLLGGLDRKAASFRAL